MTRIGYEGRRYDGRSGETVLDTLLRNGHQTPFSCRHGSCLACMRRCVRGTPTEASQRALRPALRDAGYFLPCRCVPDSDMEIEAPRDEDLFVRAEVVGHRLLADDILELTLSPHVHMPYRGGQYIRLRGVDGLVRSYSLASGADQDMELHIKRSPFGRMTQWLFDTVRLGDTLEIHGPHGSCHYGEAAADDDLLLVANGTGAAPLMGVVRDALDAGHRGRIWLFHGSRSYGGLYLRDQLSSLAARHPRFERVLCVSGPDVPAGAVPGRAHDVALATVPDAARCRTYVAGLPEMVSALRASLLARGGDSTRAHADPFDPGGDSALAAVAEGRGGADQQTALSRADLELWEALGSGVRLVEILGDFYDRVFADETLSPYFRSVTKERVIGNVYSFMRDLLTGERHYFGMKPRTAHHWMVISDETFDHRARLMADCMARGGLRTEMIERWLRIEETFRRDIVKATPWKLVVDGVEMPLDGFGEETMTIGAMCDGCNRAIEIGERVRYHLRLGLTYCSDCAFRAARTSRPPAPTKDEPA